MVVAGEGAAASNARARFYLQHLADRLSRRLQPRDRSLGVSSAVDAPGVSPMFPVYFVTHEGGCTDLNRKHGNKTDPPAATSVTFSGHCACQSPPS